MLEESKRSSRNPLEIYPYNLDWQIIDGILKHTKVFPKTYTSDLDDPYDLYIYFKNHPVFANSEFQSYINNFINDGTNLSFLKSYLNYPYPLTLSGQIIAVADEIAQRISDFDDTIRILKKRNIKRIASTKIFKDLVKRINDVYKELKEIDESKRTKTCKSTINYCNHILQLLVEAKENDELSFINITNRTQDFYIENLVECIKDKILIDFKYETLAIYYKGTKIEKTINYYLIKSLGDSQFIYFDEFVDKIRKSMSDFSYKNVHNSEEIEKGNSEGKKYIKKWFNCCMSDFNLCDNKVKRRLIKLCTDTFGKNDNEYTLENVMDKFNNVNNIQFKNKCKLIVLEGISYMSNNYLSNKVNDFLKNI